MGKWSEEQKIFMEWLSLPKDMREPATHVELAKQLQVSNAMLSRWKQLPGFWDGVEQVHIKKLRERLGDIYEALIEHAIAGKHPKYMEMAFQLAREQFGEKNVKVTVSKEDAQAMTTEQLASRAYELLAKTGFTSINEQDFVKTITTPQAVLVEAEDAKVIEEEQDES